MEKTTKAAIEATGHGNGSASARHRERENKRSEPIESFQRASTYLLGRDNFVGREIPCLNLLPRLRWRTTSCIRRLHDLAICAGFRSAPSSGTGRSLAGVLICVLAVGVILLFTLLVILVLGFLNHRVPPLVPPFR
jgi:hypothetical protein